MGVTGGGVEVKEMQERGGGGRLAEVMTAPLTWTILRSCAELQILIFRDSVKMLHDGLIIKFAVIWFLSEVYQKCHSDGSFGLPPRVDS